MGGLIGRILDISNKLVTVNFHRVNKGNDILRKVRMIHRRREQVSSLLFDTRRDLGVTSEFNIKMQSSCLNRTQQNQLCYLDWLESHLWIHIMALSSRKPLNSMNFRVAINYIKLIQHNQFCHRMDIPHPLSHR